MLLFVFSSVMKCFINDVVSGKSSSLEVSQRWTLNGTYHVRMILTTNILTRYRLLFMFKACHRL